MNQADSEQAIRRKQSLSGELPQDKHLTRRLYSKESLQSRREGSHELLNPASIEIRPILKQKSDRMAANAY